MGFVDAFLNSYMQQQQLKRQREQWEIEQALQEAEAIARQEDRALDRSLKQKSIEDLAFNRQMMMDDRQEERKRKALNDQLDAITRLIPMGYSANQAKAIVEGTKLPPQFTPDPIKSQIGIEAGDTLGAAPAAIYNSMSQILPQILGGISGVPVYDAMQSVIPQMQAGGKKHIDEQRQAIEIANELIQENNAKKMQAAQAAGDLPSPLFLDRMLNTQSLINSRNAKINDMAQQRDIQRNTLNLRAQEIADKSLRDWEEIRRKWVRDESEDYLKRDANEWRKQNAERRTSIMEELGKGSLELKKMAASMASESHSLRAKEIELRARSLDQKDRNTLVRIRGQLLREASEANKAVNILSRDEQSLLRTINETITTLKTKENIDDDKIIAQRIQPLLQKLQDVRIRLQDAKDNKNEVFDNLQKFPSITQKDAVTGKPIQKPKPPQPAAPAQSGLPKDLTKASVADMLKRLAEIAAKKK